MTDDVADEGDWYAALVAGEQIGDWLDAVKNLSLTVGARTRAARSLAEKVSTDRVYAQEAEATRAVDVLSVAVASLNDTSSRDNKPLCAVIKKTLKACEDARVRGTVLRRGFTFDLPVSNENDGNDGCRPVSVFVNEIELGAGVGAKVWKAAHLLANELASAPCVCRGKDVLEVGSGVGLCGLLAGKLSASSVTLSDFEPRILTSLRKVVVGNRLKSSTRVVKLDWRKERDLLEAEKFSRAETMSPPNKKMDWSSPEYESCRVWCDTQQDWGLHLASKTRADRWKMFFKERNEQRAKKNISARATRGDFSLQETETGEDDNLDELDRFDLIIGADVLYETYHVDVLPAVFARRLNIHGIGKVFGAVRDRKMIDKLVQKLNDEGFDVTETNVGAITENDWYDGGYIALTIKPKIYITVFLPFSAAANAARERTSCRNVATADSTADSPSYTELPPRSDSSTYTEHERSK